MLVGCFKATRQPRKLTRDKLGSYCSCFHCEDSASSIVHHLETTERQHSHSNPVSIYLIWIVNFVLVSALFADTATPTVVGTQSARMKTLKYTPPELPLDKQENIYICG